MQRTGTGIEHFPPSNRHAYLDAAAIKRLVRNVKPGLDCPANLEKVGRGWRLRVKFTLDDGQVVRRSVTLPDIDTALWVEQYLKKSRLAAAKRKSKERGLHNDTGNG